MRYSKCDAKGSEVVAIPIPHPRGRRWLTRLTQLTQRTSNAPSSMYDANLPNFGLRWW
jgi:hypothetical protein